MTREPSFSDWDLYMDTEPDEETSSPSVKKTPRPRPTPLAHQPSLPDTEPEPPVVSSQHYLRLKLENLLLSPKTRKVLAAQGVQTLRQLCCLSPAQLAAVPGIGPHTLTEIAETLDYYGLSLSPEPPVRSSGRKQREAAQLCLPGLESSEIERVCRACRQLLTSKPTSKRFCCVACQQSARPSKLSRIAAPSSRFSGQLAFSFLTEC
jgi:hypothetical protein